MEITTSRQTYAGPNGDIPLQIVGVQEFKTLSSEPVLQWELRAFIGTQAPVWFFSGTANTHPSALGSLCAAAEVQSPADTEELVGCWVIGSIRLASEEVIPGCGFRMPILFVPASTLRRIERSDHNRYPALAARMQEGS